MLYKTEGLCFAHLLELNQLGKGETINEAVDDLSDITAMYLGEEKSLEDNEIEAIAASRKFWDEYERLSTRLRHTEKASRNTPLKGMDWFSSKQVHDIHDTLKFELAMSG